MALPSPGCFTRQIGLILALLAGVSNSARAGFTITDLGALTPSGTSAGAAINGSGHVAGSATTASGTTVAVSSGGSGSFQQVNSTSLGVSSWASSINLSNNVAGTYVDSNGVDHGFSTLGSSVVTVSPLTGGTYTQVNGINSFNQLAGTGNSANGTRAFYVGAGSSPMVINPLGSGTFDSAAGINDQGTVIGSSEITPGGQVHAFLSTAGGPAVDLMSRNTAGDFTSSTYGLAIANNGSAVGYGVVGPFTRAFYAPGNGGALVDLGILPGASSSKALAVNDLAQAVGQLSYGSSLPGQPGSVAFLWDATYGMFDLNTLISPADQSNWSLTQATGINDSDQITGVGLIDGVLHGFLLTPIAGESIFDPVVTVPEPPAAALAALGLALVSGWARLRRGRTGGRAVS